MIIIRITLTGVSDEEALQIKKAIEEMIKDAGVQAQIEFNILPAYPTVPYA